MALQLEGLTRNVGKHAGGVVIAPSRLTDFSPLYCDSEGGGLVTQYDKNDVEDVGLVKFDFLGLRTLTIIDWALRIINATCSGTATEPLDINRAYPPRRPETFELLRSAETTAVFQLESRGMRELIAQLRRTVSRTSSPSWPCSVPDPCSRAWSTTSSTASTGAR
jgi:DNA polymerase-3 subunit alpha